MELFWQQLRAWTTRARAWSREEWMAALACAITGLVLPIWAWRLWPEWRDNPDLSHGFLALPLVVMLWIRARGAASATPSVRGLPGAARASLAVTLGVGTLGAALFTAVYAAALGWGAGPTLFLLSATAAGGATLAALLASAREVRWIALGWPALVIPLAILLSAPLPPGTYMRLTLGLQEGITVGVVETLRLVGVPAMRSGNVIHLGNTAVGVEEACSGVRSLISCVLAGLALSALMLRTPGRRVLLVLAAAPLAIFTNFVRSLTLTLLARSGTDISGAWHDGLGFAVLGVTTALLAWIAVTLEERELAAEGRHKHAVTAEAPRADARQSGPRAWIGSAVALLCVVLALSGLTFVAAHSAREASGALAAGPAPDLGRLLPESPTDAGWQVTTRTDLERFAGVLQTTHLIERTYRRAEPEGNQTQVTVYLAWWQAGASTVSAVAAHTPDVCWPGAGWELVSAEGGRRDLPWAGEGTLRAAEQRVFRQNGFPQTVWFWHLVGGELFAPFEPRSWRDQLALFLANGPRPATSQAFVRISSNRAWQEIADEPLLAELLAGVEQLGLPVSRGAE